MKTAPGIVFCATLMSLLIFSATTYADEPAPCEDVLADLRAKLESATLSDADKAKVDDLLDKGIERCNADDDARADEFFAQALKIVAP